LITERNKISQIAESLRNQGKRIVFTNGCFDILHAGHVSYLEQARSHGDVMIIGLNNDASVKRLKGHNKPINCEQDRAMVLSALRCVDYVSLFEEDTPYELIREIKPDILIKGGDYMISEIVGADFVQSNGGKVLTIPLLEGRSTSNIIEKIISL